MEIKDVMKLLTDPNTFLIIGKKHSGKTSLGFEISDLISENSGRKKFIFKFPRPDLLPKDYENVYTLKELYNLSNSVIIIDDAHRYFDILNKKINEKLKKILTEATQLNNSIIFITHNSYFITHGLFSYIDVRIIKEVTEGHWAAERRHMQAMYEDIMVSGVENYYLDSDYYSGYMTFKKPIYFTEEMSNIYAAGKEDLREICDKVRQK